LHFYHILKNTIFQIFKPEYKGMFFILNKKRILIIFIKLIIDRFEKEWAILETQDNNPITFNFPHIYCPKKQKKVPSSLLILP